MTIKQYGGVFGRNPTFNDVTIDGTLTFDGDIDINSDLKIDGDLEVNGKTTINNGSEFFAIAAVNTESNNNIVMANNVGSSKIMSNGANLWIYTDGNASSATASGATLGFQIDGSQNARLPYGNLIIGTSGKGIDFSATAGTGTSELLSDYEEGVWSGGLNLYGGVGTVTEERYTKIGNLVIASCNVGLDGTADGSGFIINGLPFTPLGSSSDAYGCTINYNTGNEPTAKGLIFGGTASIKIVTNTKSEISYTTFQNGSACELSLTAIYYA